jgi:acyl dehydratase
MISGLLQIKLTRVSTRPGLEAKRLALAAHRSQFENLTGDPDWAFLDRNFSRHFLQPWELFFKLKAKRYGRR